MGEPLKVDHVRAGFGKVADGLGKAAENVGRLARSTSAQVVEQPAI
jgi:X-X-X-Leu-X-X-Gly heptad repeat protein